MDNQQLDNTTSTPQTETSSDSIQTIIPTKNMPALLAYYFGVFGLIPYLGLPLSVAAIVMGVKGLSQFKQTPTPGAKGHALAGVILGVIELFIFIAAHIAIFVIGAASAIN